MITGIKFFRKRANGTYGPLFVDRKRVLPVGVWLKASMNLVPPGLAKRPGWHMSLGYPRHLTTRGRVVCQVEVKGVLGYHQRPVSQGGTWVTSKWLRIIKVL